MAVISALLPEESRTIQLPARMAVAPASSQPSGAVHEHSCCGAVFAVSLMGGWLGGSGLCDADGAEEVGTSETVISCFLQAGKEAARRMPARAERQEVRVQLIMKCCIGFVFLLPCTKA